VAAQEEPDKFKETIRAKTRRTHGHSLQVIIEDVNRTTTGWFEYFNTASRTHSATWMPGYGCGYAVFSANAKVVEGAAVVAIIKSGHYLL